MIAMSLMSTYEEYRRNRVAPAPVYVQPARPVRQVILHVLSLIGLGVGGMAAGDSDDDDILGIG